MLRYCLDLREAYLYKDSVAPWNITVEKGTPSTERKKDPYEFVPVKASSVSHYISAYKKFNRDASLLIHIFPLRQ